MENKLEEHSFIDGGTGFPKSRDYAFSRFVCKFQTCISNFFGTCVSPANCVIGEDGRCEGFKKRKEEEIMKTRKEYFEENMIPYIDGKELDKINIEILKKIVNLQLDTAEILSKVKDPKRIKRIQLLINDVQTLVHMWKKKDGSI